MVEEKHQVIFLRGGDLFDSKEQFVKWLKATPYTPFNKKRTWRDWLEWSLSEDFELFAPMMPNKQWADYDMWKIWFEKIFPYLKKSKKVKLIVIGQSTGGVFISKYLSENKFPKEIDQLHLVSPVFDGEMISEGREGLGNFDFDKEKLAHAAKQCKKIFIYHSRDDKAVPFGHSLKYLNYLKEAEFFPFEGRGHFDQPAFMEILITIRKNL